MEQQNDAAGITLGNGQTVHTVEEFVAQIREVIGDPEQIDQVLAVIERWRELGLTLPQIIARFSDLGERILNDEIEGE